MQIFPFLRHSATTRNNQNAAPPLHARMGTAAPRAAKHTHRRPRQHAMPTQAQHRPLPARLKHQMQPGDHGRTRNVTPRVSTQSIFQHFPTPTKNETIRRCSGCWRATRPGPWPQPAHAAANTRAVAARGCSRGAPREGNNGGWCVYTSQHMFHLQLAQHLVTPVALPARSMTGLL